MQFLISQQSLEGKDELEMIQIMNIKTLNASFTQNKWNFRMFLTQSYCMAWNIENKSIGLILWCFLEIDRPSARSWKRTDKILVTKIEESKKGFKTTYYYLKFGGSKICFG